MNYSNIAIRNNTQYNLELLVKSKGGQILGNYINCRTKILFQCVNAHKWYAKPTAIQQGNWCPECYGNSNTKAEEEFMQIILQNKGKIIDKYVNSRKKITIECEFGHRWNTSPNAIKQNRWCAICSLNIETAKKNFEVIITNRNGKLLEQYINSQIKVLIQCEYGHQWKTTPNSIQRGTWCPNCNQSKGENIIASILNQYKIDYKRQYQHPLLPKFKYDFYFIYNNVHYLLEFDGVQHFEYGFFHKSEDDFQYKQNVDRMKSYVAIQTGYRMIRIDYTNINNIFNCLINGINSGSIFYVSSLLYDWIYIPLPYEFIQKQIFGG